LFRILPLAPGSELFGPAPREVAHGLYDLQRAVDREEPPRPSLSRLDRLAVDRDVQGCVGTDPHELGSDHQANSQALWQELITGDGTEPSVVMGQDLGIGGTGLGHGLGAVLGHPSRPPRRRNTGQRWPGHHRRPG